MKIKNIAFIGLGNMGYYMASHLIKKNYTIFPHDINKNNLKNFYSSTKIKKKNFLESVEKIDCVILMVPSSKEVNEIIFKSNKLSHKLKKNAVIIDMSTSIPTETLKIGKKLKLKKIKFYDCPVAGGVKFAKTGELTLFFGGTKKNNEIVKILNCFGKIIWCGKLGSGHSLKALNNFINASVLNTYLEAITTAVKFGIKKDYLINAIDQATTGKNHPYFKKIKDGILLKKYNSGFTLNLLTKDVLIANNLIKKYVKKAPISSNILKLLKKSKQKLGKNSDQLKLYKMWSNKI
jgi:3-hydroxyisobutyrate dehydrogenase|tara:strand:- start:2096 stop:2971 length:876 start_codon:yes stop_codon:yes gene_type:complete